MTNSPLRAAMVAVSLFITAVPVLADYTRITFTATVSGVESDTGGGTFSGLGVGATITGEFRYGTSEADATSVDDGELPVNIEYYFTGNDYGASVTSGSAGFQGDRVWLFLDDNFPVDAEDADIIALVNEEFGLNIQVGDPLDSWGLDAESQDAIFDSEADCLVNGVDLEIILVDTDATMYTGLSFLPEPPGQAAIDAPLFFIEEASGEPGSGCDNIVYLAYGTITDIQYELIEEEGTKPMSWLPLVLEE